MVGLQAADEVFEEVNMLLSSLVGRNPSDQMMDAIVGRCQRLQERMDDWMQRLQSKVPELRVKSRQSSYEYYALVTLSIQFRIHRGAEDILGSLEFDQRVYRVQRSGTDIVDLDGALLHSDAISYHPDELLRKTEAIFELYDLVVDTPYSRAVPQFVSKHRQYLNRRQWSFFSKKTKWKVPGSAVPEADDSTDDSTDDSDDDIQPSDAEIVLQPLQEQFAQRHRSTFARQVSNFEDCHSDSESDCKGAGNDSDPDYQP